MNMSNHAHRNTRHHRRKAEKREEAYGKGDQLAMYPTEGHQHKVGRSSERQHVGADTSKKTGTIQPGDNHTPGVDKKSQAAISQATKDIDWEKVAQFTRDWPRKCQTCGDTQDLVHRYVDEKGVTVSIWRCKKDHKL